MMDLVYTLAIIAFFAVMVAYVPACDRIGRRTGTEEGGG